MATDPRMDPMDRTGRGGMSGQPGMGGGMGGGMGQWRDGWMSGGCLLEALLGERLTGRTESILVTTSMVGCDLPDGLCKT